MFELMKNSDYIGGDKGEEEIVFKLVFRIVRIVTCYLLYNHHLVIHVKVNIQNSQDYDGLGP